MTDLVVVGSGLFGLTVAEQAAARWGADVTVVERRDHIGGNAHSETEPSTGIEVHRYGSHIFHTSNQRVWDYVTRFTRFNDYTHRVQTVHRGEVYPMPITLATINQFFRAAHGPDSARELIREQAAEMQGRSPQNLTSRSRPHRSTSVRSLHPGVHGQAVADGPAGSSCVGDSPPAGALHLRCAILQRPVRGPATDGYAAWLSRMADHPRITVRTETDFLAPGHALSKDAVVGQVPVVYTGPIDAYFDFEAGS